MVEEMNTDTLAFQKLAKWAKDMGASRLAVKDGHYEIDFFMDPRVFAGPEEPRRELTDAEKEDALRAAEEARTRRLFRST